MPTPAPPRTRLRAASALAALALLSPTLAGANLLNNGDFETAAPAPGFAPGWAFADYLGGNGVAEANVVFDTSGGGTSMAVRFNVGANGPPGGLQLSQGFSVASGGSFDFGIDVATVNTGPPSCGCFNADGGTYVLAVDGVPLASFAVGAIAAGVTVRQHLGGSTVLAAGAHSFQLDMTRSFVYPNSGLWLYVDNAGALATPVPEPAAWALLLAGGLTAGVWVAMRRRQR